MNVSLAARHREAGAISTSLDGVEVPRHYGDPSAEYRAAVEGCAVVDRSHRGRVEVSGKDPGGMLTGVLTGRVPAPSSEELEEDGSAEVLEGRGSYSAVLTPKGRMVTDLRLLPPTRPSDGYLLDVPRAGVDPLFEHFRRFLPPRLARAHDRTEQTGALTVLGPEGPSLVSRVALGERVEEGTLSTLEEDAFVELRPAEDRRVRVVRTGDAWPVAFDVISDAATIAALWSQLREAGARPAGIGAWETLRVEKGRPAYGREMDSSTIPVEVGIQDRAIDHGKGCYTGQEVIVRIRDRGKVNRNLRGFLLGEVPAPDPGTELYIAGRKRSAGEIRTSVWSPRFGQTVALGYLRRELEPPGSAMLGRVGGPSVEVRGLDSSGWKLTDGDPDRATAVDRPR